MAAKSAGIIPGSPVQTLDTEDSQDLTSLSNEDVSMVNLDHDISSVHQNGSPPPTLAGVSVIYY